MAGLRFDARGILRGLDEMHERTMYGIETAGRVGAAQMERYAKTNHPWTNHSHFARDTMQGKCAREGDRVRILIEGGVRYAVYLEYAMGKRWAILWPTIRRLGPEILRQIARIH